MPTSILLTYFAAMDRKLRKFLLRPGQSLEHSRLEANGRGVSFSVRGIHDPNSTCCQTGGRYMEIQW